MAAYNQKSQDIKVFHAFPALEGSAAYAGYAALIAGHSLCVPAPDYLCAIGVKHRKYDRERWHLFTPRHKPEDTLHGHLTFALKYEGIDLAVLKALFDAIDRREITAIVRSEPTGAYSRCIWFLYEWLTETRLELEDATQGSFVPLVNGELQYTAAPRDSRRHRVRNNLPGSRRFCPMIRRTEKLDRFIGMNLSQAAIGHIGKTHADLLRRAAAFLLLKDSKASYLIEGETPPHTRIERWGRIIGEAGRRKLSVEEFEYLQSVVIVDNRFVMPGCRVEGGFVGDHDRVTGMPLPVHISARSEDVESLLSGLIDTYELLIGSDYDAVLMAALIAFGFVFIHPFEDGNGRIHRYLLHHVLAEKGFIPTDLVFPVSAVILDRIDEYRRTLEHYSRPALDLIEWRPTDKNNVEILNRTIDLYRYFDATRQAEFLFECVEETVNKTLPEEIDYLTRYDLLGGFINNYIDMPDKLIDLLIRFLRQNNGRLSKRGRAKEFDALTDKEIRAIESKYDEVFHRDEYPKNRVRETQEASIDGSEYQYDSNQKHAMNNQSASEMDKPKKKRSELVICYDFDGTLIRGNMQENSFIPDVGLSKDAFWAEVNWRAEQQDMDEVLAYMQLMIEKAHNAQMKFTRDSIRGHGKGLEYFPGVMQWFDAVNALGKQHRLVIKHFVISSGLREMIKGSDISQYFEHVFASGFSYDSNDVPIFAASSVNYTTKTQYLFRINKGILNSWDNKKINKFMAEEERPQPFSRMIYIGDGETDVPAMKMMNHQGGYSIVVYPPKKGGRITVAEKEKKAIAQKLMTDNRSHFCAEANYEKSSQLFGIVTALIERVSNELEFEMNLEACG